MKCIHAKINIIDYHDFTIKNVTCLKGYCIDVCWYKCIDNRIMCLEREEPWEFEK